MARIQLALAAFVCVLCVAPRAAHAGDFVDTRLNFTLTNENVLVKPGETNPSVPGWRFGQPSQLGILFFDNYDTRYTGYENLTHLVVYKKVESARVVAEGAYVLRLLQFTDVNLSSIDDGSYVRLQFFFDRTRAKKLNIAFTAFPLNSDRMRLGFSWRISWGGSPIFFKYNPDLPIGASAFVTNTAPAPGAKIQIADERWYAYAGLKTSTLLDRNPNVNEQVAIYGLLAGAGVDIIKEHLRLETNGGYFDRGTNPLFFGTAQGPNGMTFKSYGVDTFGASVQLSAFNGISPSQSVDMRLYRNDPLVSADRYFERPVYSPKLTWLVSGEFTGVGTTLQNVNKANSTDIQSAFAGDVNIRAQKGHLRMKADVSARTLSYVLLNQPSLVPYQDYPNGSSTKPEIFGAIGADYGFERYGLTVGGTVGIQQPATFTPNGIISGALAGSTGGTISTAGTIVVRDEGDYSILPDAVNGHRPGAVPIYALKAEVREDFLEYFAAIVQAYYQLDENQTILGKAADGSSTREFNYPHRLGFNITLQARY
jgi:hypothetical protein